MKLFKQHFIGFLSYTGVGLLAYAFQDTPFIAVILLMFGWLMLDHHPDPEDYENVPNH